MLHSARRLSGLSIGAELLAFESPARVAKNVPTTFCPQNFEVTNDQVREKQLKTLTKLW